MTVWRRGIDAEGRLFTMGIDGERLRLYFPDEEALHFRRAGRDSGITDRFDQPVRYSSHDYAASQDATVREQYGIDAVFDSQRHPREYFPRIYSGPETPHPRRVNLLEAWVSTTRAARMLYTRLREVFRVVEPIPGHRNVYSHELRQLLILACTEVESAWRAVLSANGYRGRQDRWSTQDYVALRDVMRLHHYAVVLSAHPAFGKLQPFASWRSDNATTSLPWYDAYNAAKHDREGSLHRASLGNVVDALAAVFVMTLAQFGPGAADREDYFHPDEFRCERYPREISDWYIRPMPEPLEDPNDWPTAWVVCQHPSILATNPRGTQ
jgi:hypothetical protein